MAGSFCDRVDLVRIVSPTAASPLFWPMGVGWVTLETAKIEICKTNLECPLESTKPKNGGGKGAAKPGVRKEAASTSILFVPAMALSRSLPICYLVNTRLRRGGTNLCRIAGTRLSPMIPEILERFSVETTLWKQAATCRHIGAFQGTRPYRVAALILRSAQDDKRTGSGDSKRSESARNNTGLRGSLGSLLI